MSKDGQTCSKIFDSIDNSKEVYLEVEAYLRSNCYKYHHSLYNRINILTGICNRSRKDVKNNKIVKANLQLFKTLDPNCKNVKEDWEEQTYPKPLPTKDPEQENQNPKIVTPSSTSSFFQENKIIVIGSFGIVGVIIFISSFIYCCRRSNYQKETNFPLDPTNSQKKAALISDHGNSLGNTTTKLHNNEERNSLINSFHTPGNQSIKTTVTRLHDQSYLTENGQNHHHNSSNQALKSGYESHKLYMGPNTQDGRDKEYQYLYLDEYNFKAASFDVLQINESNLKIESEKPLGDGEFGIVFKGMYNYCHSDGINIIQEEVCVKIPKNESKCQEHVAEFKMMARLDHKYVLPTYGIILTKQQYPRIVTPYMFYKDLESLLRNSSNNFSDILLKSFATQIAEGMAYITFCGLVHRDLAARNIMVTESTTSFQSNLKQYHLKIADLGLTQDKISMDSGLVDSNALGYKESNAKLQLPLKWLAPEIIENYAFNEQTDVWAFGVTVWEILTKAKRPYSGMKPDEAIRHVRSGGRLDRPENCDDYMWEILSVGCWHQNPFLRFSFNNIKAKLSINYPVLYEDQLDMTEIQKDLKERKTNQHTILRRKMSTATGTTLQRGSGGANSSNKSGNLNNQIESPINQRTIGKSQSVRAVKQRSNMNQSQIPPNSAIPRTRIPSAGHANAVQSNSNAARRPLPATPAAVLQHQDSRLQQQNHLNPILHHQNLSIQQQLTMELPNSASPYNGIPMQPSPNSHFTFENNQIQQIRNSNINNNNRTFSVSSQEQRILRQHSGLS